MTQVSGDDLKRRFGTRAVHAGHIPDPLAGAQMTLIWTRLGLEFTFVDAAEAANIAAAVTPQTKMVYAETPTNPMMRLCDLAAAGEIARRAGALFVVDNTFATPYF